MHQARNLLAAETSPYLLQHAGNPVHWRPWGPEALAEARATGKPILLSIGYAACHWCHVMAHESFENPETAALMNALYVNVKVDREERPDIDQLYMSALQMMGEAGGWPLTMFLTPEGDPFWGGTYFPPTPRWGRPSFRQVLEAIAEAYRAEPEKVLASTRSLRARLAALSAERPGVAPDAAVLDAAAAALLAATDPEHGGMRGAPKFPMPPSFRFLWQDSFRAENPPARAAVHLLLRRMGQGGIYDHLGGGFARSSTDDRWLVPHFEKMLYDNALLARVYLHAWQVTGNPLYRQVTEETLDFVAREMRHEAGGFYSSYDADSEGEEGKFYVWTAAEIRAALGDDAPAFMAAYDVSEGGNWDGHTILNTPRPLGDMAASLGMGEDVLQARLAAARRTLYDIRSRRVWPGLDDKVLTAWNGLMLAAFAEAGRALGREDYTAVAVANAEFLRATMRTAAGRLRRSWCAGSEARYNAYLEDYAFLAEGLLALYQTTFDARWFAWARELADLMLTHFADPDEAGFYDTSDDHEILLQRPKDLQDNATPSGNAMAATVLLKLGLYTGEGRYWDAAEAMVAALYEPMARYPNAFAQWLTAASFMAAEPREVAIIGDAAAPETQALLHEVFAGYRPELVVAAAANGDAPGEVPLLAGRTTLDGRAAAYVCRRFVCQRPTDDPAELRRQLDA